MSRLYNGTQYKDCGHFGDIGKIKDAFEHQDISASDIINTYRKEEMTEIFYKYGEERWSKRIAEVICERREQKRIETTGELADIVLQSIPKRFHVKNIHPATRIFQALRIVVNNELEAIEKGLNDGYDVLQPGGRMMAISFHSLEDRIVKNRFRRLSKGCVCDLEPKHCNCNNDPMVKILTKKPVMPMEDEIAVNKRARSSKLRVCEKL